MDRRMEDGGEIKKNRQGKERLGERPRGRNRAGKRGRIVGKEEAEREEEEVERVEREKGESRRRKGREGRKDEELHGLK